MIGISTFFNLQLPLKFKFERTCFQWLAHFTDCPWMPEVSAQHLYMIPLISPPPIMSDSMSWTHNALLLFLYAVDGACNLYRDVSNQYTDYAFS